MCLCDICVRVCVRLRACVCVRVCVCATHRDMKWVGGTLQGCRGVLEECVHTAAVFMATKVQSCCDTHTHTHTHRRALTVWPTFAYVCCYLFCLTVSSGSLPLCLLLCFYAFFLAMFQFFHRALRCTCSTNVCSVSYKYKYTQTHTACVYDCTGNGSRL